MADVILINVGTINVSSNLLFLKYFRINLCNEKANYAMEINNSKLSFL